MKQSNNKSKEINRVGQCVIPQEEFLLIGNKKKILYIGIPNETEKCENRICLTPQAVDVLVSNGHHITIEKGAGLAANYSDMEYVEKGAIVADSKEEVFQSDIILKVAPFDIEDVGLLRGDQTVFSALHLYTQTPDVIRELSRKKITAIAMENYKDHDGCCSFVRSMGEIAGYSSILIASEYLSNARGGKGIMLGGITGISPTEIVILGAGTSGEYAAKTALSLGAEVKVFDNSLKKLRRIQDFLGQKVFTSIIHTPVLEKALLSADVLIGAMRNDDSHRSIVVTESMIKRMKPSSFVIDLSIDTGGCIETAKAMSIKDSAYRKDKIIHYCVPNIASRVPRTATIALSNIFIPLLNRVGVEGGISASLKSDIGFREGAYMYNGILTSKSVADKFGMMCKDINLLMAVL